MTKADTEAVVEAILAATFGPAVAAEVVRESDETPGEVVTETVKLPAWWRKNQDGQPRKTSRRPDVSFGLSPDVRRETTNRKVLDLLLQNVETVADLTIRSGFCELTIRNCLDRLMRLGLVTCTKEPARLSGGRRRFLYRALVGSPSTTPSPEPS